ncbi:MAG: hypothetical protein BGO31_00690 [Bacteroidetes bacterium 43-16]|nr:MAG: hypothetical protein BGO31_00690 [Bacteroidetes bacterium 43-16]
MHTLYKVFAILLLCLTATNSFATHLLGGELHYKYLSSNGTSHTYELTLVLFGDCGGSAFGSNLLNANTKPVQVRNGAGHTSAVTLTKVAAESNLLVSPICASMVNTTTCNGGATAGIKQFVYRGNVTITEHANWVFYFSEASRSSVIQNTVSPGTYNLILRATLNNTTEQHSSPEFTTNPTSYICINQPTVLNVGALALPGDSLAYNMIAPITGVNATTGAITGSNNFVAPLSVTQPMPVAPGNFSFSAQNGNISFTQNAMRNCITVTVIRKFRNGVEVGTTMREMTYVSLNNCANSGPTYTTPVVTGGNIIQNVPDAITINACKLDTTLDLSLSFTDPQGDNVTLSTTGAPAGMLVNFTGNGSLNAAAHISWALNNVPSGPYTFYLSYADDGCPYFESRQISITVNVKDIDTPFFPSYAPICAGAALTALPDSSINGIHGAWSPALNNTTTTNYTFTPLAGSCALSTQLQIQVNPSFTPVFTQVNPICAGDTLQALPLVSNNNYTGTWSPALNNTATTTYTFSPASGQQCVQQTTMQIQVNTPVLPAFNPVAAICEGAGLNALPLSSNNNITGTWSPAINNLATTNYTFTPNTGQCATPANLQIQVNPNLVPAFNPVAAICAGAPLNALPTTSTNNFSGSWQPAVMNNTATTNYTFTPNAGQCATTASMQVQVNPNITPLFTPVDSICAGAVLNPLPLSATNNITGTWSPALNNMATTTYTFSPAAGQCATSTTMQILVSPNITPVFTQVAPICAGAALNALPLSSNNNYTGTWSPALNNTATTTYTFTPAAGQCATTATMQIQVNPYVTPTFNPVAPICTGSALNALPLTSNNNYTGTWSPALNNTATTTYTFTPDAGQCAHTTTLTIQVNPYVTPVFTQVAPICAGAALNALPLTSNNNYTGTWSPALNNNATTTYTFTANPGQCANNTSMQIQVNPNITPTFTQVAPLCIGSAMTPLPTVSNNNYTGTWSPALNNTSTTTYTFTPAAGQQCVLNTTMQIQINPLTPPLFSPVNPVCIGSSIAPLPTTAQNGITGNWTPAINNAATTTYTFTPDPGQCAANTTLQIAVNPYLTALKNITICQGNAYTFKGVTYTSSVSGIVDTIHNTNTCDSIITLNLTVAPVSASTEHAIICEGSSYTFNGQVYTSNNNTASYTIPNHQGCDSTITLDLTVLPGTPILQNVNLEGCGSIVYNGQTYTTSAFYTDTVMNTLGCDSIYTQVDIKVHPEYKFRTTTDLFACESAVYKDQIYTQSTSFTEDIKTAYGCDSLINQVNITVKHFRLHAVMDPEVPYKGEQVKISTSSENGTDYRVLSWTPSALFSSQTAKSQYAVFTQATHVIITGESEGCTDTAMILVGDFPPLPTDVRMPNAFSPNGDGRNDVFRPVFGSERGYSILRFRVYNRYGQLIHTSANESAGWDGTFKGKLQDQGVYYYHVIIHFVDGTEKEFKGDVTLIH